MLKLRVPWRPPVTGWAWTGRRYVSGTAWLEPFEHPALEKVAATDGENVLICVRERRSRSAPSMHQNQVQRVSPNEYQRLITTINDWSLDYILVQLHGHRGVSVSAGVWGSAPIYLSDLSGTLYGSWSLSEIVSSRGPCGFVDREVCRFLTLRHRYGTDTMFRGVHRLTERARARFTGHGLAITYPAAALHALPRSLRPGADVLGYYEWLLTQAVQARDLNPGIVAVELSGGLDSTNVALTLATSHSGPNISYALMLGGAAGQQQAHRRELLVRRYGFHDMRVAALDHPPFNPAGRRAQGLPVNPYDEPYSEAFEALLATARNAGVRVAMTGIGGDELVALYATESDIPSAVADARRPVPVWLGPRAKQAFDDVDHGIGPGAVLAESCLLASACRAPTFLTAGIWPVSPLCSPDLIRFAESLPLYWRRGKYLHRARLAAHNLPADWLAPPLAETFGHVMDHGLRHHGHDLLDRVLLSESVLADNGYVDTHKVAAVHHDRANDPCATALVHAVLHLELALRSVV